MVKFNATFASESVWLTGGEHRNKKKDDRNSCPRDFNDTVRSWNGTHNQVNGSPKHSNPAKLV